jgi:predicted TIM-barrel fold metal-dependent hydrolase
MSDYEIIDTHVHLSRTPDEEKNHFLFPGRRDRDRWTTPAKFIEFMDRNNVAKAVVNNLIPLQYRGPVLEKKARLRELPEKERPAAKAAINRQVGRLLREMNEWCCHVGDQFPRLIPFIVISDDLGSPEELVEEIIIRAKQGARGVKIHPGIFSFYPNDKAFWPMYQKCQELGLPVLSDSGPWPLASSLIIYPVAQGYRSPEDDRNFGQPENWAEILESFPRLTVILAHLGSAWWDERVELAAKYPNIYFDTSQGFSAADQLPVVPRRGLAEEDAIRVCRKIGVARIMFGTDLPSIPLQPQLEQILRLPFTEEEKRMILSGNARHILGI